MNRKKLLAGIFLTSFALGSGSFAAEPPQAGPGPVGRRLYIPARGVTAAQLLPKAGGVTYHGGPVLVTARAVLIFWGPTFANASSPDHAYATTLQAFRNQFGMSAEYNVLTQYYQIVNGVKQFIQLTNLGAGTPDWFDTSTPPTKVTDALVQREVNTYLASHTVDYLNTMYQVVIPSTSYSDDGAGDTSCGGPNLQYCAYHSWIGSDPTAIKYTIQPYPSCSGCQVSGWTAAQNQEHFLDHEIINTVSDPTGHSWFSNTGQELADLCAWSPSPFLAGGFGYQYTWSNASGGCIKTR
jgi:hypothetical protein